MDHSVAHFSGRNPLAPSGPELTAAQGVPQQPPWPASAGILPEPALLQAHLQYQLAQHNARNASLQVEGLDPAFQRARMTALDMVVSTNGATSADQFFPASWPPGSVISSTASVPQSAGYWGPSPGLEQPNSLGSLSDGSMRLLHSKVSQLELQTMTLDRVRRELSQVHHELDKAEREVLRQKSLRESERQEFTEAKDRLKHSWANDREDFARVKTMLRTKNAEHHAQSARLSQQLKDTEACNRALRDIAGRHGIFVPQQLESNHLRRFHSQAGQSDASVEGAQNFRGSLPIQEEGRGSMDSYFQKIEHQKQLKPSLPSRFSSQPDLLRERDSVPGLDTDSPRTSR